MSLAFMTSQLSLRDHVSNTLVHISGPDTTDTSVACECLFCSGPPRGYARAKAMQLYTGGCGTSHWSFQSKFRPLQLDITVEITALLSHPQQMTCHNTTCILYMQVSKQYCKLSHSNTLVLQSIWTQKCVYTYTQKEIYICK